MMTHRLTLALLVVVAGVLAGEASAGLLGFTSLASHNAYDYSLGWEFQVGSQPINVTRLEFYDKDQDGLLFSHAVGIFDSAKLLVASGTVRSGTQDPLDGQFRYTSLATPVTLSANGVYRIAAVTGSYDPYGYDPIGLTWDPAITYTGDYWSPGGSLAYPVTYGGRGGYYGPNLDTRAEAPSVPEPASCALLALAAGGVGTMLSKRRRP